MTRYDDRRGPSWRILVRAGDTYALSLTPVGPNGTPVVVDQASGTIWRNRTQIASFATSVDPVTGEIVLGLSASASDQIGPGRYRWELRVEIAGTVQQWLTDDLILFSPGSPRVGPMSQAALLSVGENVSASLEIIGVGPPGPPGPPGPSDASQISFTPCGPLTEVNMQDALCELSGLLSARIPPVKSSIYLEDNATPTSVSQNVAAKVLGGFQAGPACISCSYSGNQITYIGSSPTRVLAVASADVNGPNNQTYLLEVRRNGLAVPGARVKIRAGTAIANGTLNAMIDLDPNDFVELWITNQTSGQDPTVVDATIALMN